MLFKCVYVCICVYVSFSVCTAPCLGLVGPSRTAKPEVRPEPALAISEPDSCSLYWGHNKAGVEPENKEDNSNSNEMESEKNS